MTVTLRTCLLAVPDPDSFIFIDPDVAVGYEYSVTEGPLLIDRLIAPTLAFDNQYDLFASGDFCKSYDIPLGLITGGSPFNFSEPQSCFAIRGIDVAGNLDPENPLAFVTGISFDKIGTATLTQTPITEFVSGSSTSVPGPLPLMGLGAALGWSRRLRRRIKGLTVKG